MPDLNEAADNLRAIEAMVAREFARIDVPKAPDVRPAAEELAEPELDARNPHASPAMTAAQIALAVVGLVVGFLT